MIVQELSVRFECPCLEEVQSLLSVPDFAEQVVELLDAGEELFTLKDDASPASLAGEFVVRLNPSDRLLVLMATCGAGHS